MKKYLVAAVVVGLLASGHMIFAQNQAPPRKSAPGNGPGQPGPQGTLARLGEFLQLTPDQEAKLKDFRKARAEEQKTFRDQARKLREELAPLLRDPKADEKKIDGLVDQIAKLGADRVKNGFQNRREVRKIFTPEQLEKLKTLRGRWAGRGMMGPGFGPMGRGFFAGPLGGRFGRGPGFFGLREFRGRRGPLGRFWRRMPMGRGWLDQDI